MYTNCDIRKKNKNRNMKEDRKSQGDIKSSHMHWSSYFTYIALTLIIVFAYIFSYQCGSRGFFPFDQSIVYDGAWRIIQGQIPYKDFIAPIGPVTFLYQADIFSIFGVNYASYLIGAAVMNAISAIIAFLIINILIKKNSYSLSLAGALISAIFFYAQMGTTYHDQTAIFFCMLSLFTLLYTESNVQMNKKFIMLWLSGVFWVLAFLSKQNFAALFLPLIFIIPFFMRDADLNNDQKDHLYGSTKAGKIFWLSTGITSAAFIFTLWLLIYSDIHLFFRYFFTIPIKEGLQRFQGKSIDVKYQYNPAIVITNTVCAIFAIYSFITSFIKKSEFNQLKNSNGKKEEKKEIEIQLISLIVLYLISYSIVMLKTTNNNEANAWGFLGIYAPLGAYLIYRTLHNKKIGNSLILIPTALILLTAICYTGINSAWHRKVQDFNNGTVYTRLSAPETLQALQWCETTPAGSVGKKFVLLKSDEVKKLINFLENRKGNFFIFSDFTALYGFLKKPSPQPMLWFHKGLTYPRKYDKILDQWIVSSLKKNSVKTIIVEEISWFNNSLVMKDFPLLEKYINDNFKKIGYIGFHIIYIKK